ncbi:uncharacterized protein METZ01_LOCUS199782, partial [marine metagenome]
MDTTRLEQMLQAVADGNVAPQDALAQLRTLPFEDLGFARVDHHRALRTGYPETIFCQGKTPAQVVAIAQRLA